jgi:hypothetical protein
MDKQTSAPKLAGFYWFSSPVKRIIVNLDGSCASMAPGCFGAMRLRSQVVESVVSGHIPPATIAIKATACGLIESAILYK